MPPLRGAIRLSVIFQAPGLLHRARDDGKRNSDRLLVRPFSSRMLKNAFLAFFNAPGAALVRTRLRRIKHLQCLNRGETSLSPTSRLFFNSLLSKQAGVIVDRRFVALAGCGLEPAAGLDGYIPARIMNESFLLKHARGNGNCTPSHAEHVGEELVREVEMIRVCAVMGHQQPAHQTCLDIVEPGAGDCLGQLRHRHVQVSIEYADQAGTVAQSAPELRYGHSQCRPRPLHYGAQRGSPDSEHQSRAEHTFIADHCDLQRFVTRHCRHQGNESREGKENVAIALVRLTQDSAEGEIHKLTAPQHSAAFFAWQAFDQAVDDSFRRFGWHCALQGLERGHGGRDEGARLARCHSLNRGGREVLFAIAQKDMPLLTAWRQGGGAAACRFSRAGVAVEVAGRFLS